MLSADGSPNAEVVGPTLGTENLATATTEAATADPTAGSNINRHVTFATTTSFANIDIPFTDTLGTLTNQLLSTAIGDTPGGPPHAQMVAELETVKKGWQ